MSALIIESDNSLWKSIPRFSICSYIFLALFFALLRLFSPFCLSDNFASCENAQKSTGDYDSDMYFLPVTSHFPSKSLSFTTDVLQHHILVRNERRETHDEPRGITLKIKNAYPNQFMEFELAKKNIQDQSTVSYALLIFQCHESLVNKIYVYSLTILSFTS